MKPFYTPPINNDIFNEKQALKESYNHEEISRLSTESNNNSTNLTNDVSGKDSHSKCNLSHSSVKDILTSNEIELIKFEIQELPSELTNLIDIFITDLKQPKYENPLTVYQLSSIFQLFYTEFDKAAYQYLTKLSVNSTSMFVNARDALSTGLSGIFARSRSSSTTSNISRCRNKRSSSLFSNSSFTNINNATPLLSSEEISQQLKQNATNDVKCVRYLELCERDIFNRLMEVGTSATLTESNNNSNNNQMTNSKGQFSIKTLFRNTPEYIDFDEKLGEKIQCLNRLNLDSNVELINFLGMSNTIRMENNDLHDNLNKNLIELTANLMSPYDKISKLLDMHNIMSRRGNAISNDDFLSILIYHIIELNPKNIFLTEEFIKLFRYKKRLIESEMFALTNLNAALMFLEGLTLNDLPDKIKDSLTEDDYLLFKNKISDTIILPTNVIDKENTLTINNVGMIESNSKNFIWTNFTRQSKTAETRDHVMNHSSYESIKSVLDGSLKHIISKVKTYSPVYQETTIERSSSSKNNSQLFIETDRHSGSPSLSSSLSQSKLNFEVKAKGQESISSESNTNEISPIEKYSKYKNVPFEGMTISQLREMYDIYQKLVE